MKTVDTIRQNAYSKGVFRRFLANAWYTANFSLRRPLQGSRSKQQAPSACKEPCIQRTILATRDTGTPFVPDTIRPHYKWIPVTYSVRRIKTTLVLKRRRSVLHTLHEGVGQYTPCTSGQTTEYIVDSVEFEDSCCRCNQFSAPHFSK